MSGFGKFQYFQLHEFFLYTCLWKSGRRCLDLFTQGILNKRPFSCRHHAKPTTKANCQTALQTGRRQKPAAPHLTREPKPVEESEKHCLAVQYFVVFPPSGTLSTMPPPKPRAVWSTRERAWAQLGVLPAGPRWRLLHGGWRHDHCHHPHHHHDQYHHDHHYHPLKHHDQHHHYHPQRYHPQWHHDHLQPQPPPLAWLGSVARKTWQAMGESGLSGCALIR